MDRSVFKETALLNQLLKLLLLDKVIADAVDFSFTRCASCVRNGVPEAGGELFHQPFNQRRLPGAGRSNNDAKINRSIRRESHREGRTEFTAATHQEENIN